MVLIENALLKLFSHWLMPTIADEFTTISGQKSSIFFFLNF